MDDGAGAATSEGQPLHLTDGQLAHLPPPPWTGATSVGLAQLYVAFSDECLDPNTFEHAWSLVTRRHQALRLAMTPLDAGRIAQAVHQDVVAPMTVRPLPLAPAERERELAQFLEADRTRGLHLATCPLFRVTVFVADGLPSEVVWTYHRTILDDQSVASVWNEVFDVYQKLRGEIPIPALAPPSAYQSQLHQLVAGGLSARRPFFASSLSGNAAPTPAPGAQPPSRPLLRNGFAQVSGTDDGDLGRRLAEGAAQTGTTPEAMVQAAWAIVVSRYTGASDVVFGTSRDGRTSSMARTGAVIGPFDELAPVRVALEDPVEVGEVVRAVVAESATAVQRGPALYESHAAWRGLPFESLLAFRTWDLAARLGPRDGGAGALRRCELHEPPGLPLLLRVIHDGTVKVTATFDRRRFDRPAVQRVVDAFLHTLRQVASNPRRLVGEVQIIPPAELAKIVETWNDTAASFSDEILIHELFERRARMQPEAVAVDMDGQAVTYAQLDRMAERIAGTLAAHGARERGFVAVCLDRGVDMVAAFLAVLKAGAAYVPLDPRYPPARLALMLEATAAWLTVTNERYRSLFPPDKTLVVDVADHEAPGLDTTGVTAGTGKGHSREVACVFFTSGSTGQPNGVAVSHRAMVNTLEWVIRTFAVRPGDRLLFVTSPCFDLSVFDIFGTLAAGGTIVIASDRSLAEPSRLSAALVEQGITIWNSAPAAVAQLIPFLPESPQHRLRLVLLSGDWIPLSLPDALRAVFVNARVISLGGATEAAIWSNWFPVETIDPRWTSIPYGRPIQNCRYHVLDAALRVVPVGVAGNLYIGGVCLADGYLNRPTLTKERFIPDPWRRGERLYATGDLARYFDSGDLEFLGRADFQVKVRGFRVELEEVEAAMLALPDVREAVCVAPQDLSGERSIVAYLVTKSGQASDPGTVRAQLAERLPAFMVPSQVITLRRLPLSPNGKVDRKALRPEAGLAAHERVAPRTELERQMVDLWEKVLDRQNLGVTDDFFEVGGHSLLAVILVSRMKSELGLALSLDRLIERRTIAGVLGALAEGETSSSPHIVSFNTDGSKPPLVFFPGGYGSLLIYRELPELFGPDQPVYLARPMGADGAEPVDARSVEAMAAIYERELLALVPEGPLVLAGFSFGALVIFELLHRMRAHGREVPLAISLDGCAPGYPKYLPAHRRLLAHWRHFTAADAGAKRDYIRDRFANISRRVFRRLGWDRAFSPEALAATPAVQEHYERIWTLNRRATSLYRPAFQEHGPLLLIKASQGENWLGIEDRDSGSLGWKPFIRGEVSIVTVTAHHDTLLEGRNKSLVVDIISQHLARTRTRTI